MNEEVRELTFLFASEELDLLPAVLELASAAKLSSRAIIGWSAVGPTLRLHSIAERAQHQFPTTLEPAQAAVMVRKWVFSNEPAPAKHDFDVSYNKGYLVDGRPFDEDIHVTVIELEYHK